MVEQIASGSLIQAKLTKVLREDHDAIEDSSTQTYQNLETQMGQTKSLVSLSSRLLESVGVFTLPAHRSNVRPIDGVIMDSVSVEAGA